MNDTPAMHATPEQGVVEDAAQATPITGWLLGWRWPPRDGGSPMPQAARARQAAAAKKAEAAALEAQRKLDQAKEKLRLKEEKRKRMEWEQKQQRIEATAKRAARNKARKEQHLAEAAALAAEKEARKQATKAQEKEAKKRAKALEKEAERQARVQAEAAEDVINDSAIIFTPESHPWRFNRHNSFQEWVPAAEDRAAQQEKKDRKRAEREALRPAPQAPSLQELSESYRLPSGVKVRTSWKPRAIVPQDSFTLPSGAEAKTSWRPRASQAAADSEDAPLTVIVAPSNAYLNEIIQEWGDGLSLPALSDGASSENAVQEDPEELYASLVEIDMHLDEVSLNLIDFGDATLRWLELESGALCLLVTIDNHCYLRAVGDLEAAGMAIELISDALYEQRVQILASQKLPAVEIEYEQQRPAGHVFAG